MFTYILEYDTFLHKDLVVIEDSSLISTQQKKPLTNGLIKYGEIAIHSNFFDISHHFFLMKGNELVGAATIQKSPYPYYGKETWWLSFLSIHNRHQNNGYSSYLADYIFKYFKENGLVFETSSYTETGFNRLKPLFNKLAKKYDVPFIDKGLL